MAEILDPASRLWKLLWDYDPNGLLVLDSSLRIRLVNPALCRMLKRPAGDLVGRTAAEVLGDVSEFRTALEAQERQLTVERSYPQFDLYVRKVIFPIPDEEIVAGIFVDLTTEWKNEQVMRQLKQEAIQEVRLVVDKQMHVAQEIAGLLGETTAETKVSLLRLLEMLQGENV